MMKFWLTYGFVLILFSSFGQTAKFEEGNSLYDAGSYEEAIEAYGSIVAGGNHSADLYFNLGNAHYRNGDLGKAIWAYESALKIEPDHDDALFNLEFAIAQTEDQLDTERRGFGHWLQGLIYSSSVNLWAYASIVASALFSLFVLIFLITKKKRLKNIGLLSGSIFALLFITTVVFGYLHKKQLTSGDEGVIITEHVDIRISPMEDAESSFILSEGAKVTLIDEDNDWVQIDLNGNQGWLQKKDVWEL